MPVVKNVIKNMVLVLSVLLAFILVWQIWFSSYILPGGYDFFVAGLRDRVLNPVTNFFRQMSSGDMSQNLKLLLRPEQIVISVSGERRAFHDGQEHFDRAYALSNDVISEFLSGGYEPKSVDTVDMDTYSSVLKGRSIYVDYGKNCDFRLFSFSVCGEAQTRYGDELGIVRDYAISLQDGIMNDISIYMMDYKSSNIYRYVIELDKSGLEAQMSELVQQLPAGNALSYAFELNFHKEQAQSVSKVLFSPMILMDLMPVSVPAVGRQELTDFESIPTDLLDEILRTFSINARSMRQYTDLSGARVFVENNATLTLYPEGRLEYQTVGDGRGLDISADKSNYDIYAAATHAVDFVTDLCSHFPPEFFEQLRIQSDLAEDSSRQGTYRIAFDYCIDGVPVRHQTEEGYAHAVELEIVGGYLKSYRQYLRVYETRDAEFLLLTPVLSAADMLVDSLYKGAEPLHIHKINVCYAENEAGQLDAAWRAVVDGNEQIVR